MRTFTHLHGRHQSDSQQPQPQQQLFGGGSRWHEFRVLRSTVPSGNSAIELSLGKILLVLKLNTAAPARSWRGALHQCRD
jgi:hypothetical protein